MTRPTLELGASCTRGGWRKPATLPPPSPHTLPATPSNLRQRRCVARHCLALRRTWTGLRLWKAVCLRRVLGAVRRRRNQPPPGALRCLRCSRRLHLLRRGRRPPPRRLPRQGRASRSRRRHSARRAATTPPMSLVLHGVVRRCRRCVRLALWPTAQSGHLAYLKPRGARELRRDLCKKRAHNKALCINYFHVFTMSPSHCLGRGGRYACYGRCGRCVCCGLFPALTVLTTRRKATQRRRLATGQVLETDDRPPTACPATQAQSHVTPGASWRGACPALAYLCPSARQNAVRVGHCRTARIQHVPPAPL